MHAIIAADRGRLRFSFWGLVLVLPAFLFLPSFPRAASADSVHPPGGAGEEVQARPPETIWEFQDLQGTSHRLEEFRGRVVLLEFWASWCIPCRKGFPFLDALQAKYAAAGLQVVAVTLENDDEAVGAFLTDFPGVRFLVGRDRSERGGELYGVEAMPSAFLLDRDGRQIGRIEGGTDAAHQRIEAAVEAALRGGTIAGLSTGAVPRPETTAHKAGLRAWDRGYLADPIMSLDGGVLKRSLKEHVFASKEGAAGDGGVAGGGCGCN